MPIMTMLNHGMMALRSASARVKTYVLSIDMKFTLIPSRHQACSLVQVWEVFLDAQQPSQLNCKALTQPIAAGILVSV